MTSSSFNYDEYNIIDNGKSYNWRMIRDLSVWQNVNALGLTNNVLNRQNHVVRIEFVSVFRCFKCAQWSTVQVEFYHWFIANCVVRLMCDFVRVVLRRNAVHHSMWSLWMLERSNDTTFYYINNNLLRDYVCCVLLEHCRKSTGWTKWTLCVICVFVACWLAKISIFGRNEDIMKSQSRKNTFASSSSSPWFLYYV